MIFDKICIPESLACCEASFPSKLEEGEGVLMLLGRRGGGLGEDIPMLLGRRRRREEERVHESGSM